MQSLASNSNCVIIGAGPAGCVAAIILARAGISVTLVEQHRFPRDKVCGECLSALGISVLDRLDLRGASLALRPTILRRCLIHAGAHSAELNLPEPMWGLSRHTLDRFLLDQAIAAGAKILQPARCEKIDFAPKPLATLRDLQSNQTVIVESDQILIADGKRAWFDKPKPTGDLGFKAHFRDLNGPGDSIELFGVNGHYGGIAPIEGDLWNLAFNVPQHRVRARDNHDALLTEMMLENPCLAQRMQRAKRVSDWLVSPLPRYGVARHWPTGCIPIGNAAAAIEPIGGEGMGLALRSAELAATAIISAIEKKIPLDAGALRKQFRSLWRWRRVGCRAAAKVVSSPRLRGMTQLLRTRNDSLTSLALWAIGKA